MTDQPKLPASCRLCVYFGSSSACLRHAPSAGQEEFEVVYWPRVAPDERCGSGAAVTDGTGPGVTRCQSCVHWWQPNGEPLTPYSKQGLRDEWWAKTGYCTRYAPSPSPEEDKRTRWRVTNGLDGCGDGAAVEVAATDADHSTAAALPAAPRPTH